MSKVRLKLIKSPVGYKEDQSATVRALGLRRIGHEIEREDSPTLRGMVHKVQHLVHMEEA